MANINLLNYTNELSTYRLKDLFTDIDTYSVAIDTPPSLTTFNWYFNLCGQKDTANEECPKNSQICGVQKVSLNGEPGITTQIISIDNGINYNIEKSDKDLIDIRLGDTNWGTHIIHTNIHFICSNEVEISTNLNSIDNSNDKNLVLEWKTPGACLKDDKEHIIPSPTPSKDDSWGWFTWFFIVAVLLGGGYIIAAAWVNSSRGGDFPDAFHDFVDTLKNLAVSLPGFINEILGKVFGRDNDINRGGYTSV
ncbi:hypothetical protein WICMUC_000199 [Wickerhamomyces mucosus]|uniref:Autophagy-related protein 27 n=1 Tax=Wickerhamomyces mucosus TaxID=1378264 RepID=A0A9P8PY28_9ASCO|nr:hypothetical protein WICMUC_000199 [Wickerhamomyces mucosus]